MNRFEAENKYWNYYLHLEKKFLETGNYVAFSVENYKTFSNEYTSLLQAICSEIDVIFKQLCGYPGDKNKCMKNYNNDIKTLYPNLKSEKVNIPIMKIELQPFADIENEMIWWTNYNGVKHNRVQNYRDANFENVLMAIAALFILNRILLDDSEEYSYHFVKHSEFFKMDNWCDEQEFFVGYDKNGDIVQFIPDEG